MYPETKTEKVDAVLTGCLRHENWKLCFFDHLFLFLWVRLDLMVRTCGWGL
jgi:hypothetical protein